MVRRVFGDRVQIYDRRHAKWASEGKIRPEIVEL